MNFTKRPSFATPRAIWMIPAITPAIQTFSSPYLATIPTKTTAIAPVGPVICTGDPPNTAATTPATIAV